MQRTARWLFRPVGPVPYAALNWVAGTTCVVTFWTAVGLSPGRTISETSQELFYTAAASLVLFAGSCGVVLSYPKQFRLLYSDRKNPFRSEIAELVRLNRELVGRPGELAASEQKKLTQEIRKLREWPAKYSKEELQSFTDSYLAQTAQDRKLALEGAQTKLSEYERIAEELRRAIQSG